MDVQDELPALAKSATEVEFKPGQSIIKQGEEGNEFFMIKPLANFYDSTGFAAHVINARGTMVSCSFCLSCNRIRGRARLMWRSTERRCCAVCICHHEQ